MANPAEPAVGRSVSRKDGIGKATGAAKYADDLTFPGMIWGRTIRSEIPRGEIRDIRREFDQTGFTVVDFRDIPGKNVIALIEADQPCLVEREIRHLAEPILLLAHEDRERLGAARVVIDYERLPAVLDAEQSDVVFKHIHVEKGNVDDAFARAELVVEGTYRTGAQEHVYIEPNGVIAVPEDGGIAVHGSIQCPFYVHKALVVLLGEAVTHVRVVQTETGGGFGGKEEFPSVIAAHAALLALKAGRPVKIIYDRTEDMVATTKRHPSVVRHRTAVTREGHVLAMDIDVLLDGGAYTTLSPVVLSRGTIHAAGPYRCENTRIVGRAVMTNTPPNGAFRGFGAPQTQFAMEVHMDQIAESLGMDPVRLRERNALRPGDTTATGQTLGPDCSALETLRRAVRKSRYREKRAKHSASSGGRRGIGVSLFYHGSGFTGSGELRLASRAAIELTERGVRVLTSSTEIGQGTRTMHAQIVADALGVPYEQVDVAQPDTSRVPDSGPTVASRTCMVVGGILQRAAAELRKRIGDADPADHFRRHGPLRVEAEYEQPDWIRWDDQTYTGDAYATYGWGCNVAEVDVDPVTFEVKPLRLTAVVDVGKAIHPALAVGQIEGGTAQALGFALLEHVVMRDGGMANAQLTNYTIPTTLDTPPIDVVLVENPYPGGPFGAKGLGELPMDGPAPAIVNAIRSLGIDVCEVPALPEVIHRQARASARTR
jgi:CO/xanthine dehydrogenase Mo-binding subunit